ncbi:MAG: NAD(P)-dependent oxidoreductase, partial [Kiritimatiellia bacterium]|nr:NAD(P)-dependent oxidoreductase [Kiritimatiellia bacterium]
AAGPKVIGISRGQNRRVMVDLGGVEMVYGDKNDESFIRDTVAKLDYNAVISSVPSINDVDLCHKYLKKAENVFLCSSTGTFVPLRYFPADENHPWREKTPVNFWSQCIRDAHALELWEKEKFPASILRPTNIIGPDRVPLELWGSRNIDFFKKLKAGEIITIAPCENILLQSGYNADLAGAFVKALDYPDKVRGEIFIISCKKAIALGRYLQTAMEFLKSKSEIRQADPEELLKMYPGVKWENSLNFLLEHMCFDISKAEKTFGYSPEKTAEEGLVDALEWCEASGLL